jgi:hypothetical protein
MRHKEIHVGQIRAHSVTCEKARYVMIAEPRAFFKVQQHRDINQHVVQVRVIEFRFRIFENDQKVDAKVLN